ncbi:hypothetical protein SAMN05444349_12553 [Bacteroides faecichinchillae]|uniref:Uncharacterized protein n=1 Tax=Bacteroides faecichinchillae TaxID=871325 RepID=A0A1M5CRK0_9BACE|nr:hypothetical protein SAMN05444349_12553 [Bacteroides faecichinchillae]
MTKKKWKNLDLFIHALENEINKVSFVQKLDK